MVAQPPTVLFSVWEALSMWYALQDFFIHVANCDVEPLPVGELIICDDSNIDIDLP